jgi:hypothetical protein
MRIDERRKPLLMILMFFLSQVYVGFPFSHDVHSMAPIKWRILKVRLIDRDWDDASDQFDRFGKDAGCLFITFHMKMIHNIE